jgi:hypothetical protein
VIGAMSLVPRQSDIPADSVWAGVPVRPTDVRVPRRRARVATVGTPRG